MNKILPTYLTFALLLLLAACANVRSLKGGEKDGDPPIALAAYPAPLSTFFNSKTITLLFDEYVQLNDIHTNLVISPPLQTKPKIKVRKKSVIIELQEDLLPNTTYFFNFGDGIADVNELNKAQDLTYVFSTGAVIDSLMLRGRAWDVFNDVASKKVKIMAFESDTTIFSKKSTPLYFTRTKDDGTFTLPYMREGEFYLYALDDQNNNYRHDDGEAIGVLQSKLNAARDTVPIAFQMSVPRAEKLFINDFKTDSVGTMKFALDAFYKEVSIATLNPNLSTHLYRTQDSVYVWLKGMPADKREAVSLKVDTVYSDTLDVLYHSDALKKSFRLPKPSNDKYKATDVIEITPRGLITLKDENSISLVQDSIAVEVKSVYDSLKTSYSFVAAFKAGKNYTLQILPDAFENSVGATNDTLQYSFSILKTEDLGNLILQVSIPDSITTGRLILKDKNKTTVFERANAKSESITISGLLPGDYSLHLHEDANGNGIYDPIDLKNNVAPEIMHNYEGKISLRANWDLKTEWKIE